MDSAFVLDWFQNLWSLAQAYFLQNVLSSAMAVQILVIAGAVLLSFRVTHAFQAWFTRLQKECPSLSELCADLPFLLTFTRVIRAFLAFLVIVIAFRIADHYHWPRDGLYTACGILLALAAVRLFTGEMQNRFWAKILAGFIWFWTALYIFHLIEPWVTLLSHIDFNLGQAHLSLLHLIRALPFFLVLYWLSKNLAILANDRLRSDSWNPDFVVQTGQYFSLFRFARAGIALPGA
jgi:hypothetical protein